MLSADAVRGVTHRPLNSDPHQRLAPTVVQKSGCGKLGAVKCRAIQSSHILVSREFAAPLVRDADYTSKWIASRWRTQRPNRRRSDSECYRDLSSTDQKDRQLPDRRPLTK